MGVDWCSVLDQVQIEPGTKSDYAALARFHYRGGRPVGVMRIFVARYRPPSALTTGHYPLTTLAGVIVECRPVLNCAMRGIALAGRYGGDKRAGAVRLNAEMRVISRVVVVPRFRGIGLGVMLVRHVLATARTRYVEAMAAMGRVHPLFERAGMRRVGGTGAVYYLWEGRRNAETTHRTRSVSKVERTCKPPGSLFAQAMQNLSNTKKQNAEENHDDTTT